MIRSVLRFFVEMTVGFGPGGFSTKNSETETEHLLSVGFSPKADGRDFEGFGVHVCIVCPFYPASSVHPVSVVIPHPREIYILWSQTVRQRKTKNEK